LQSHARTLQVARPAGLERIGRGVRELTAPPFAAGENAGVPGAVRFLPSECGFAFTNAWPVQPAVVLATPFGTVDIGDASAGLCGGMVFAALDYWHAGLTPPAVQPAQGEALFGYLVRRLIDSWHLPLGVMQYYQWMNLPAGDRTFTAFGRTVVGERGLAWRTIKVQWPQIADDLDHGIPVPLGVVTVESRQLADLGHNHQVLATGYRTGDGTVTVEVYDPNQGRRDDIHLRFDPGTPTRPTVFDHNLDLDRPVRGFFRTAYAPCTPPT